MHRKSSSDSSTKLVFLPMLSACILSVSSGVNRAGVRLGSGLQKAEHFSWKIVFNQRRIPKYLFSILCVYCRWTVALQRICAFVGFEFSNSLGETCDSWELGSLRIMFAAVPASRMPFTACTRFSTPRYSRIPRSYRKAAFVSSTTSAMNS